MGVHDVYMCFFRSENALQCVKQEIAATEDELRRTEKEMGGVHQGLMQVNMRYVIIGNIRS